MIRLLPCLAVLAACTPAAAPGPAAISRAPLYCGIVTAFGPLTVALVAASDPTLAPVAVTTKIAVDAACALAGGVPVVPPPAGVVAPRVAVAGEVAVVK